MIHDLTATERHSLRRFDPHAVARLETEMWRSYYGRNRLRLAEELVELLREQYHLPFWKSFAGAVHATRPAAVFQDGHNRAEYERALPDLVSYYSIIWFTAAAVHRLSITEDWGCRSRELHRDM